MDATLDSVWQKQIALTALLLNAETSIVMKHPVLQMQLVEASTKESTVQHLMVRNVQVDLQIVLASPSSLITAKKYRA